MSSTWTICVNGRSFGPYTLDHMRSFAAEGRLAPHSQVARGTGTDYRMAAEDAELALLFRPAPITPHVIPPASEAKSAPVAKQATAAAIPAAPRPVFFTAEGDIGTPSRREAETQLSRFLILADMKSRSIAGLEEQIMRYGVATAIMPQAWLLTSEMSLNALRGELIQRLGRLDTLFIADIGRNKSAWFNFGPEADTRIRRVWQEAQKSLAAE